MKTKGVGESIIEYQDLRFFLLLIPLINALNYYLTYTNITLNTHLALTFLIDTLQGFAAWLVVRYIIIRLDKKMPYEPNPVKRILLQILITCIAGLLVIIITTEILNSILKSTPVPASFYQQDIFIFLIWFFVINGIYISWHYFLLWKNSEKLLKEEKKFKQLKQEGFLVKQGKQSINISLEEIAAIYVQDDYAVLITNVNKKYLLSQSLDSVEKQLPAELFFRINRQVILHRTTIKGFEKSDNGKINIHASSADLLPALSMSRTRVPAFKSWFNPE